MKLSLRNTMIAGLMVGACAANDEAAPGEGAGGKSDSSAQATFLTLTWEGTVRVSRLHTLGWDAREAMEEDIFRQALFTVGQLNGEGAVGQLDRIQVDMVESMGWLSGQLRYRASMPVAWNKQGAIPATYDLLLPESIDEDDIEDWYKDVKAGCVEASSHAEVGTFYYYYRPHLPTCRQASSVLRLSATLAPSGIETQGKYPEYTKLWEDQALNVIAVFGKVKADGGATDGGLAAYQTFRATMEAYMASLAASVSTPILQPDDVTYEAKLTDGRTLRVTALLVDDVTNAGEITAYQQRFAALSGRADLIMYNGHTSWGEHSEFMAKYGTWLPGQYRIVYNNGCDTYMYLEKTLNEKIASVNPDDNARATRYLDNMANVMPANFHDMSAVTERLIRGLMATDAPLTYQQIMAQLPANQIVVVTGEQDNAYQP